MINDSSINIDSIWIVDVNLSVMSSLTIHMKHISQEEYNQKEIDDCQPKSNWVRDEKWESMLQYIEWSEDELMITIIYLFCWIYRSGTKLEEIGGNWEGGKSIKQKLWIIFRWQGV